MASQPSNYGDDSFTDQRIQETGLIDDIKSLGPGSGQDVLALIQEAMSKGKPYDDKTMVVSSRLPVSIFGRQTDRSPLYRWNVSCN